MGTYKVIQDIEAEDKLLGPLTLRQFIYAIIVIVMGFVAFKLATLQPLLAIPFLPPMILLGVLASPFSKDQPSEVWLLAKIRFFLKPRKRIWDQSGIKELVTITVPKKIEHALVKDLTQTEVRSRLEALANTIDSRGWAVKNVNVNMFAQPSYVLGQVDSDRLIDPATMAQDVSTFDVGVVDDILDVQNSHAQVLDQMIASSSQIHKQQLVQNLQNTNPQAQQGTPADYWFLNQAPDTQQPSMATFSKSQVVLPGQTAAAEPAAEMNTSAAEKALLDKIHSEKAKQKPANSHLRTINPLGTKPEPESPKRVNDQEIANLARNNDLNIATVSREANKARKSPPDDEVVVSLR